MPYIGTSPSNGVRQTYDYTATAGQTSFSGSDNNSQTLVYTDSAYIDVYQNGILLIPSDYTATTGTTVVLDTGATVSDTLQIVVYDVFSVADTVSASDGGSFGGNVGVGGTLSVTGIGTFSDDIIIGDGKTIGSASDVDAMTISSGGAVTFSQNTVGAGDMVLLSTITASADDEIDFTGVFTSAYRDYEVIGSNIHTSDDGVSVRLRVFVGGGIKSDSHYRYSRLRNYSGDATPRGTAELTDTEFNYFGGRSLGNATGEHSNFRMIIYNPLGTDNFKTVESITTQIDAGADSWNMLMSGHYKNGVAALTGIRFFVSSGNIASGTFKLYGRQ